MAKSKEERIYDEFFNRQRKEEYRNRNKDPMELALAEQRAAHTVMYEEPVRQEDNSTISWDEAEQVYQETLKNQPSVEESVVPQPQVEQEKEPEITTHEIPGKGTIQEKKLENGSSEFVYLDKNGKMFCYETDRGLHFFAHDVDGRSMGSVDYFDNEFTKAEFVTPEGKEIEFSATEDHQLDSSKMGEEEISAWNTLSAELTKLTEQRSDFINQWKTMEQQKENVAEQADEFVIESVEEPVVENVVEPEQLVEEPVVENVVEPEQLVEEPVVENVVEPEHLVEEPVVVNVPEGQVVDNPYPTPQPVDEEDDEHTGSFGIGGAESEEDEDEGHKGDSEKDILTGSYLGGPEKLQRWLKTYAIEGALSNPQVGSPFAGISSVQTVSGFNCKSVSMETGNRMFVGNRRIDYSNGEQKAPTLQEALTMVRMGQMNGWTSCRLKGSAEMNKQLFIACQILGMPVKDFVPTEEMIKAANEASAMYNPPIQSEGAEKARLINRVQDLDERFEAVDSYAGDSMPSFESVREAHANGYTPFSGKTEIEKQQNTDESIQEQQEQQFTGGEKSEPVEENQPAEKIVSLDEAKEMDLTPVDGKYNAEQTQAISKLYDQYHDQADRNLAILTSHQNDEKDKIDSDMSEYTRKTWDAVDKLVEDGKPLSAEQQKMLKDKNTYISDCEEDGVVPFEQNVPSRFWPERAQKVASEQKNKVALKYMYAAETTKRGLVSLMGASVKTPSMLQDQDIEVKSIFPDEDFSKLPVSEQLKQIGKMRADTIKKETEVQKAFGKMTDGKQLTSVTGKYQIERAQESDKQFDNQVKKNLFGKYSFRDAGR